MRVLWTGTFDPEFSRNKKLARLMRLSGVRWRVLRENVWATDRVALASRPSLVVALRALIGYPKLLVRLLMAPAPDVYLVSYPGWFDVPIVRLAASIRRRPLVFDPFLSLFDTMISDRGIRSGTSLVGRLASAIDRWSLRLADVVIADTEPQLAFYRQIAGRLRSQGSVLAVGADDELFVPLPEVKSEPGRLLYYGNFIPLHGAATIVEAAALLESNGIKLVMIGDGPDREVVDEAIARTGLSVERHGIIPLRELPEQVARATVCLGVFGGSQKAGRVIPHKVYEALAMRKPVVTREGPAVSAAFPEGGVVTVPPQDAAALADAVRGLIEDPPRREKVAAAGHQSYRDRFQERALAADLFVVLEASVQSRGSVGA
ncbi:MAG TPA: glycosyltransferase [Acidimicrobiia bacterium]|nr:glycosyltransferase [Acidimicrobiia bacterium]